MFRFSLALFSAMIFLAQNCDAIADERNIRSEDSAQSAEARGLIKASLRAKISAELVARVEKLPFKEGDRFATGDVLVEFDCDRYRADYRVAMADVNAAKSQLRTDKRLHKHGAIAVTQYHISRSKFDRAQARAQSLEIQLRQCRIVAPFDGRVVQRHINQFEFSSANSPLIEIVGKENVEVELIIPSKWLVWLKPGQNFRFQVDETGRAYGAKIIRVGAVSDHVSQTVRVFGRLFSSSDEVLPGMSGTARFGKAGS